jgi:uncharacterized protein DUF4329
MALTLLALQLAGASQANFQEPPADEVARVKARFAPLQHLSFATGREYCGYVGETPNGELVFTEMQRGGHSGCTPKTPLDGTTLNASIHTHGSYDHEVPAEFPTVLDMQSDAKEGVNGYIATPGGRLWYIDSRALVAVQLCGVGCLPQDPDFHPGDDGVIPKRLTIGELRGMEHPDNVER